MYPPDPLRDAPIRSLFFQYYSPALVSTLSVTLHQVINGLILGRQVGQEGMGAVGLYGPVISVLIALALPLMIGGGILVGKAIGAAAYGQAQAIFQFATTLVLLAGGILALSAPVLAPPLARFLTGNGSPLLLENATDYIRWQLAGLPFFFLNMVWGNFIRADKAPNISRNASLIAVAVNILLDFVLIVGLHRGVEGASIATAVALFSGTLYLMNYLLSGKSRFTISRFRPTLQLADWPTLWRAGLPSFASEIAFSTGLLLVNQRLVAYGPHVVAAFGIVNYLSFLFIRPLTATMIALLPILSFSIGAHLPRRALAIFRFSLLFSLLLGGSIAALGWTIPGQLVSLFSGEANTTFQTVANQATRLYFLLFIAAGPNYVLAAYLQSIGRPVAASAINVLKGVVLMALFLSVLPDQFDLGLHGVWLSRATAEIAALALVGGYTFWWRGTYYSEKAVVRT